MMMVIMMMMVMMMMLMVILLLMMASLLVSLGTVSKDPFYMIGFNIERDVIYFVFTSTLGGRDSLKPFAALVFGPGGGGGLLFGGGWWGWVVPPGSLNPDPISDQKI